MSYPRRVRNSSRSEALQKSPPAPYSVSSSESMYIWVRGLRAMSARSSGVSTTVSQ